ncbi:hypothetical protein ACJRO7_011037, partial [Eucalyptus globulus]
VCNFDERMEFDRNSFAALPTGTYPLSRPKKLASFPKTVHSFLPQLPSSLRELALGNVAIAESLKFSISNDLSTLRLHSYSMLEFS